MDHQSHEVGTVYAPAGVYWVQLRMLNEKGAPDVVHYMLHVACCGVDGRIQ